MTTTRAPGPSPSRAYVDHIEPLTDQRLRRLFDQARASEYQPIVRRYREAVGQLDHRRPAPAHTGLDAIKTNAAGIERELDRVRASD